MARAARKKAAPEEGEVSEPSMGRRILVWTFRAIWTALAWLGIPVVIAGLLIRLTVRDDVDAVAWIFYATPWAVLTAFSAICTIHWRARKRVLIVAAIVFAGCFTMWVARNIRFGPDTKSQGAFRVAYWNVARPEMRLNSILAQANRMEAQFYVFGEHRFTGQAQSRWEENFGGRFVMPLARELLFVAPEAVKRIDGGSLGGAGGCQLCRAMVKGREVFFLLVDFTATYNKSRRPAFDRLFQIIDAYAEKPLLVIGDFNTPSDSAHFDRLRTRLKSAFESSGSGYAATWPMPLPVLELDHIWYNKHLRVLRCEHPTSLYSDHRAVVADIDFAP